MYTEAEIAKRERAAALKALEYLQTAPVYFLTAAEKVRLVSEWFPITGAV